MSPNQTAVVGCRLLALYTTMIVVRSTAMIWTQIVLRSSIPEGTADYFLRSLTPLLWQLGMEIFACVLLWVTPPWLIRTISRGTEPKTQDEAKSDWGASLLAAAAFYYILTNFAELIEAYQRTFSAKVPYEGGAPLFWGRVITMVVAVGVVIGGKRLAGGLRQMWRLSDEE